MKHVGSAPVNGCDMMHMLKSSLINHLIAMSLADRAAENISQQAVMWWQ